MQDFHLANLRGLILPTKILLIHELSSNKNLTDELFLEYSEYDYPSKIKMVDKELKVVLIHEFSDYLNDL